MLEFVQEKLLSKKAAMVVIALIAFVVGVLFFAQSMVDRDRIQQQIEDYIRFTTGREVTVNGAIRVSAFPSPLLEIPRLEVRADTVAGDPAFTVDQVSVGLSFFSMFSDAPQVTSIELINPVLNMMRNKDGQMHWGWLNKSLIEALAKTSERTDEAPILFIITDGRISYNDLHKERSLTVENINLGGNMGKITSLGGNLSLAGRTMHLNIDYQEGVEHPLNVQLFTDKENVLEWHLRPKIDTDGVVFDGNFSLLLADVMPWVYLFDVNAQQLRQTMQNKQPFSLSLSSRWQQKDWQVALPDTTTYLNGEKATGQLGLSHNKVLTLDGKLHFEALNYSRLEVLSNELYRTEQAKEVADTQLSGKKQARDNPIPDNILVKLDVNADKLTLGSQVWSKMELRAELEDAAITVNQFIISLPGEANLSLFGIISHQLPIGLRFEGSMETSGKSLREMLMVFEKSAAELPDEGFREFNVRANIFISSEQLRLSEADVRISELTLGGGLAAYFGASPRIEADVRLRDINFDYFRNVWRIRQQERQQQDVFAEIREEIDLSWLRSLTTNIDFKVNVDQFTFMERSGNFASFRIFARPGEFNVSNIRLLYPTDIFEANFSVNATSSQPFISALINTAQFDTDYFSLEGEGANQINTDGSSEGKKENYFMLDEELLSDWIDEGAMIDDLLDEVDHEVAAEELMYSEEKTIEELAENPVQWSKDLIDMSWMEGWNGSFDISIGKLRVGEKTLNNVKMRTLLHKERLSIQSLSFGYWDGRFDVTGYLMGGIVPALSISFTMYNVQLESIMRSIFARDNISGRLSLSGSLTTSGINELSWISQAESKLSIAGRGVKVEGFDVQSVVDVVNVSRVVSDVFNNINISVPRGNTDFEIDGTINIRNGFAGTPGISLKANSITGNLIGEVKLVPWTMELSSVFEFPMLQSETIPTLLVRSVGSVQSSEMQLDTSSLEAYVAKRIIGGGRQ